MVAERIGYGNVECRKGRIQDLKLDPEELDKELKTRPIDNANRFLEAEELADELRVKQPLVTDESVDVVVQGPVLERNQAVLYKGPFRKVLDDDGHAFERGERYAVCDQTFNRYRKAPYAESFEFIEPHEEIPIGEAKPFDGNGTRERHPRETKGQDYDATKASSACADSDCC